ncbi:MAG: aspartate:alanine exchanger family transporter [Leptolyngbyaceae cyanobacterium]
MSWLWDFLDSQPVLTLFLIISVGYAIGEVSIAGFNLGVGAVLFVGLLVGAFTAEAAPPAILSTIGLILFCYGIGIQYGKAFVEGLKSTTGQWQNVIAIASTLATGAVAALLFAFTNLPLDLGAGLFSGAMVSTATLDSAVNKTGSELPIAGYGLAYPFGVFGPILYIYALARLLRPKVPAPTRKGMQGTAVLITEKWLDGCLLSDLTMKLSEDVQVVAVKQNGHNRLPRGTLRLNIGDELLLEGDGGPLVQAQQLIGQETAHGTIVDVDDLDDLAVYVSRPEVVGRKLAELKLSESLGCLVLSIIRGESELYPHPGLVLEMGDQVRVVAERGKFEAIASFFGNSARSTAEISYLSLGIGIVLGVFFGLIPFPIPGVGTVAFGSAGGALIVALVLGWRGRTGPITWKIPPSANRTLRDFGLTLFLAVAGWRSAENFITTVQATGLQLLLVGIALTLSIVFFATLLGQYVYRIRFDELLGVISGITGNPAVLAYACKSVPTNQPEIGYAITFPTSTIVKIIVVQILLELLG